MGASDRDGDWRAGIYTELLSSWEFFFFLFRVISSRLYHRASPPFLHFILKGSSLSLLSYQSSSEIFDMLPVNSKFSTSHKGKHMKTCALHMSNRNSARSELPIYTIKTLHDIIEMGECDVEIDPSYCYVPR